MLDPGGQAEERRRVEDASFGDLLSKLVDDTDHFVRAEIRLLRAQAMYRIALSRNAAIFALAGLLIGQAALGALLVGLILSLEPLMGPFLATIVVLVASLAVAGILLLIAVKRAKVAVADEPKP